MGDGLGDGPTKTRPHDQPLPTPATPGQRSMHEVFLDTLKNTGLCYQFSSEGFEYLSTLIEKRRSIGIERYGTILHAFNGRDTFLDLIEELADAAVYASQIIVEDVDGEHLAYSTTLYRIIDALVLMINSRYPHCPIEGIE